jgi:uracil-DNA glycosylase
MSKEPESINPKLINVTAQLLLKRVDPSWLPILQNDLLNDVVEELLNIDRDMNTFTPKTVDIFNFAKYPISRTKVVILGEGPYREKGVAHGYCYSTIDNECPTSLKKIFNSLKVAKMITCIPKITALNNWARQGVILMNTTLTTNIGQADAHKEIWNDYMELVIKLLAEHAGRAVKTKITWFLWGELVQSKSKFINWGEKMLNVSNDKRVNLVLKTCHPEEPGNIDFVYESQPEWEVIKERYPNIWWDPIGYVGYTDGSSKNNQVPSKARAGYGYHYTSGPFTALPGGGAVNRKIMYLDKPPKKDPYDKSKSHKDVQKNNKEFPNKHKVVFFPSNIRSEGYAILNLLKFILKKECYMSVIIFTDSQFWIDHITKRIPKIEARINNEEDQWENHKNHDLVKDMWTTVQLFKKLQCPVQLEYTPAHHDCLPEFIKDKKSANYLNYMGNKKAEEIAEACLPATQVIFTKH